MSANNNKKVDRMKTSNVSLLQSWHFALMVMLVTFLTMLPDFAYASSNDTPMGDVLCTTSAWFTGNTGKGLATIAVTIIGIGALLGKVSGGMAMIVGIGVAIVFGASQLVGAMGAGATGCVADAATTTTTP